MRPVQCLTTGQVYRSMTSAARAHGVTVPSIRRAIVHEAQCRGHYWRYVTPEPHDQPLPNLQPEQFRRLVVRSDGLVFPTLIEAGRALGRPASAINTAINRGIPVRGYLFTYAYTPAGFTIG